VVVTDGAAGAVVATADGVTRVGVPAAADGVDTCGAGDRFAGELALGLGEGAGVVAATGRAASVTSAWLSAGGVSRWVPSAEPGEGAGGERVIATGGCFDVLHAGHVELLERARAMGDRLIVLVNSDAGVRRLKGPGRPVNGVADRVRLLRALACVDDVVVFDEDDPRSALDRLRPDIWVKGGDYQGVALPEAATVLAYGGSVRFVSLVPQRSTTRLISLIRAGDAEAATVREESA
jgi:rfaE bifunctional protein nucleotidyltransferase chain/domain